LADNSTQTRVTAIQALGGVCQKALLEGRLEVLSKGVKAVDHLLGLVPEEQAAFRGSATAARTQLASFIKKEHKLLAAAKCSTPTGHDDEAMRSDITTTLDLAAAADTAQKSKQSLTATVAKLEDSNQPNGEKIKEAKESLKEVDAALQTASTVTISEAATAPPASVAGGSPSPASTPSKAIDRLNAKINDLIKALGDSDASKAAKARSELALFGQRAVKPLLEVAAQAYNDKSKTNPRLEGVAESLRKMRQPIQLDPVDAYWAVSVLRSPDQKARDDMAEFLMNTESIDAVKNCFDALEQLFNALIWEKNSGESITTVATVVGTWARNIGKENHSREAGKPFPAFALDTAKQWKATLEKSADNDWGNAVGVLNDLIARARQRASASQGGPKRNMEDSKRDLLKELKELENATPEKATARKSTAR
jgi:hypothetical protein